MGNRRIWVGLGIISLGFAAAWPFRRPEQASTLPARPLADGTELATSVFPLTLSNGPATPAVEHRASPPEAVEPPSLEPTSRVDLPPLASDLANRSPSTAPGALLAATESQLPLPSLPMSFRMSNVATDDENERLSPREYRIRKSDTLADIAERYLGSSDRAGELFDANRDVLRSPDLLPVGTMLRIPRQPTGN